MGELQTLNVTVHYESHDGNDGGLRHFVQNAIQTSCRNARNACVVVASYDENGDRLLGYNVIGSPSEEMRGEIAALVEEVTP